MAVDSIDREQWVADILENDVCFLIKLHIQNLFLRDFTEIQKEGHMSVEEEKELFAWRKILITSLRACLSPIFFYYECIL